MAIVTISRQLGSLGSNVARVLSERLDCRLLDKTTVEERMTAYGIPSATVEQYDEKRPRFWDRLSSDKRRYHHYLRGSILETARAGDCVILGRGGQVVLADIPGVIHVRVTAPRAVRVERIMHRFECDEEQAVRISRQSDVDRSGFHRFFFGSKWDDPDHYDIVVSTAKLSIEQVVSGIVHVTPTTPDARQQQMLIDRCLEMRVRTLLIYKEQMTIPSLVVEVEDGVVTLHGEVFHDARIAEVTELVAALVDVKEVDNRLVHSRYPAVGHDYF